MQDDLLQLTDPRAMRALAHPLRLRLLKKLQQDGPATATSLAADCGESSGATSFHLRQLAKYGFIEELPERGRARERWWQARARGFSFPAMASPEAGPGSAELETAAALLRSRILDQNAEELALYLDHEPALEPAWRNAALFARSGTHLTLEELQALSAQIIALLRTYERPDPQSRPADARRVRFIVYGLPAAAPGGPDAAA
jgi:DNA-binding transcriptional ArsR family regulator